jgi:hypothetical protein
MASDPIKSEKDGDRRSSLSSPDVEQREHASRFSEGNEIHHGDDSSPAVGDKERLEASHKLANPLAGLTPERLGAMGEDYARRNGMNDEEDVRAFRLGAMIAGNMNKFDTVQGLSERELEVLRREETHKWSNPWMLYAVIAGTTLLDSFVCQVLPDVGGHLLTAIVCSLSAAVQGMDETVVNGAQGFYKKEFGIGDDNSSMSCYDGSVSQVPSQTSS